MAGALGTMSLIIMHFFSDAPLWNIMGNRAWEGNTTFILVAIPLFVLMGELIIYSGISERMYRALSYWLNPIPGGLLHSNIAFSGVFGAISGSSAAATATVASVALPAFRVRGYSEKLVMGSIAAGGTMDILIPPSIAMIIYGLLVEESIGRLYLAGFIPGFLMVVVFMLVIAVIAKIWPSVAPREVGAPWRLKLIGLLSLLPFLALMFIVLGTIYLGVATPTEAAGFGVTGALLLMLINNTGPLVLSGLLGALNKSGVILLLPATPRSKLQAAYQARPVEPGQVSKTVVSLLKMNRDAMLATVRTTALIMLIVMAAFTLSFAFSRLGISQNLADWVVGFNLSPVTFVIILVVFYLALGTFMETLSMMVTTIPIIAPILQAMGVDLVWFGIIMVILLEAALISPPEGLNLYIIQGLRKSVSSEAGIEFKGTIADVWLGVLPFLVGITIVIALLIAFPEIVLWLPNLVKGAR